MILNRLKRWQRLLKNLSLIFYLKVRTLGELIFLKNWVIPKYGVNDAVKFWLGPEGSPQDFSMNDLAVEVKCQLGSTKPTIKN